MITGKNILRYQEGTMDYGLLYGEDYRIRLVGYTDSNWADSITN